MGGAKDDEPPSKRVKVSFGESADRSNGTFLKDPASCSLSESMARPLAVQGDDEIVGTKGVVKKVEFVRIIADALYSLGYKKTGALLEEESGIPLHSSQVHLFMQKILDGRWDESVATLHKIGVVDEKVVQLASFLILEQKFLELLDEKKVKDALKTLRTEIGPLCINTDRVRELSLCVLSPLQQVRAVASGQVVVRAKSRRKLLEELQKLLPPTVIIPEQRLIRLVEQALDLQLDACRFHNSLVGEMSLLTDHQCGRDQIPSQTLQVYIWHRSSGELIETLAGHSGTVNCVSWNPANPHMLASASDDHTIRIWGMNQVNMKHYDTVSNGVHYCNGGT